MLSGSIKRLALLACCAVLGAALLAGCGDDNEQPTTAGSGGEDNTQVTPQDAGSTAGMGDPNDENNDGNGISKEPPPIQILTGNESGYRVKKPTVVIVQSDKARKAMLKQHYSNGVKKDPYVASTSYVDRQNVGLFFPKSKKGTVVAISDVHQEGDQIVVTAVELQPADNCKYGGGTPYPFNIVETRKMVSKEQPKLILKKQQASEC